MSTSTLELMRKAFEKKFVHYEPVLDALLNAWSEFEEGSDIGANLILWGRGGFGKSEMARTFAETLKLTAFIQSFGASSSEEAVWGELDLSQLRDGDSIRFHLERSFLNYQFVILEEAFDLPGRILDDMKDTISARCFRRGVVQEPMKTRTLVVCTNHDPATIRKRSTSADAFIQRFALEVKVEWPKYDVDDYRKMYERQMPDYADLAPLFSNIMAGVSSLGAPIAPREALDALRTVVRQARVHGRDAVVAADFRMLSQITQFARHGDSFKEIVTGAIDRCGNNIKLNGYRHDALRIIQLMEQAGKTSLDQYASLSSDLQRLQKSAHDLSIPAEDGGYERKQQLLKQISRALRA